VPTTTKKNLKAGITVEPEETAVARQWLGKHAPAATNIHATTEELLDAVFSMRFVLYQTSMLSERKVGD
jgi:hypothetical protein